MSRLPTPMGWAGFDYGHKRAISFARQPKELQDDPPHRSAPSLCLEEDLELVLSGVVFCSGCTAVDGDSITITAADINGIYTLPYVGDGIIHDWLLEGAGSISFDFFVGPDCEDSGTTFDLEFAITVHCSGGVYTMEIIIDAGVDGLDAFRGEGSLGEPIDNTTSCGDGLASGGTATLTAAL